MNKICFVIQRYGLEVNGGAELLCMMLAERLTYLFEVDVVTTKAISYMTWEDEYKNDQEVINGVNVYRFSVTRPRVKEVFDEINGKFLTGQLKECDEQEWIDKQGPYSPKLIEYLKNNNNTYDVFIFLGYLYYPTVMGMVHVKDKAIFMPLAHDEPFLRIRKIRKEFYMPRAFFFNTEEERKLVRSKFLNYDIPYLIGGSGVEIPQSINSIRFCEKYNINNYIIYVGRIDEGKNCHEMFDFFLKFKKEHPSDLKLVLMGKPVIDIPEDDDIISLGFVSDEDKYDGLMGAKFLLLPSKYESLSMVVLEAFSLGKPVLVNGNCEVLKAHCEKSEGGFYYKKYIGFESKMNILLNNPELCKIMGENGQKYVKKNYQWDVIVSKLSKLIEYVISNPIN